MRTQLERQHDRRVQQQLQQLVDREHLLDLMREAIRPDEGGNQSSSCSSSSIGSISWTCLSVAADCPITASPSNAMSSMW